MSARVTVYQILAHTRSALVAGAMAEGIRKLGDQVQIRNTCQFTEPDADIAVFYGFDDTLRSIFHAYRNAGKSVVYADLGYWGRRDGGRWFGFHKVSVNDRHPTAYFQSRKHPSNRFSQSGIRIKNWKTGSFILLAGTSDKGAIADGFQPEEWERETISLLRKHTNRRIVYRPKPSWRGARPIEGAEYSPKTIEIQDALQGCHAVVTHHSNVAVDALIEGIPAFCVEGVVSALSSSDFTKIDTPLYPDGRQQFMNDLAFCQWDIGEMKVGAPWRHLKDSGLI